MWVWVQLGIYIHVCGKPKYFWLQAVRWFALGILVCSPVCLAWLQVNEIILKRCKTQRKKNYKLSISVKYHDTSCKFQRKKYYRLSISVKYQKTSCKKCWLTDINNIDSIFFLTKLIDSGIGICCFSLKCVRYHKWSIFHL